MWQDQWQMKACMQDPDAVDLALGGHESNNLLLWSFLVLGTSFRTAAGRLSEGHAQSSGLAQRLNQAFGRTHATANAPGLVHMHMHRVQAPPATLTATARLPRLGALAAKLKQDCQAARAQGASPPQPPDLLSALEGLWCALHAPASSVACVFKRCTQSSACQGRAPGTAAATVVRRPQVSDLQLARQGGPRVLRAAARRDGGQPRGAAVPGVRVAARGRRRVAGGAHRAAAAPLQAARRPQRAGRAVQRRRGLVYVARGRAGLGRALCGGVLLCAPASRIRCACMRSELSPAATRHASCPGTSLTGTHVQRYKRRPLTARLHVQMMRRGGASSLT
jgi:hypothetical protein